MIMKRFLTFLIALLTITCMQAQTEHLKFMGIPIDGKIKNFQSELWKKGFRRQYNSTEGTRVYSGDFSGERVELRVGFDKKTKVVYRVAVMIPCYTDPELAESKYTNYKYKLERKYQAYSSSLYSSIYDNNGVKLEEDIKNGKLTSLNTTREWGAADNKGTCIYISEPKIFRYFEGDTLHYASVFMNCLGNIGTITIKTFKIRNVPYTYYGEKYENGLFIVYEDHQNSSRNNEKNDDDL